MNISSLLETFHDLFPYLVLEKVWYTNFRLREKCVLRGSVCVWDWFSIQMGNTFWFLFNLTVVSPLHANEFFTESVQFVLKSNKVSLGTQLTQYSTVL